MQNPPAQKIAIVIPTYNEIANIRLLISAIFSQNISGIEQLIIVDDGSPDGTGEEVERLAAVDQRINVIHRASKQGLGSAYIAGFHRALAYGADIVVQMDADFSHDPADLPRLISLLKDADLVIGSRYVAAGQLDPAWGLGRRLLSWWANQVWIRSILGLPIQDATAGFRAWRAAALERIGLERIRANGYFFQIETACLAQRNGSRIIETPIYFKSRSAGESKMDLRLQLEAALGVLRLRRRKAARSDITSHKQ